MVQWVVGSILHGGPNFRFQPVLHNWCNKGCGTCYPVCGMMHIKEPLLLRVARVVAADFLSRYLREGVQADILPILPMYIWGNVYSVC